MIIRVPLVLQPSVAVIHRLDIKATRQAVPEGEDTTGYDEVLREPIAYDTPLGVRTETRQELAPTRVKCQVENMTEEQLKEMVTGDVPVSNVMLVFHRRDLKQLGLLDSNNECVLKKGDRIECVERFGAPAGTTVKKFANGGLYIYEVRGRSWGFGPDGYDLEFALLTDRKLGAR